MRVRVDINHIEPSATSHKAGLKKVLFQDSNNNLTQFAHGRLRAGELIEDHVHPTMDEYFYFLDGTGIYRLAEEEFSISAGVGIFIEHGVRHRLEAKSDMTFIYFGIAIPQ